MSSHRKSTEATSPRSDAATSDGSAEAERQSIGRYLQRQRELRGISLEELAQLTRIPLRSLQRLEAGSFDDEVDGFVRGFVRTVALALGLDADYTVSRMLAEPRLDEARQLAIGNALPHVLVGLALVVLLVAGVGLVRFVASDDTAAGDSSAGQEVLYRRDPVRALAEAEAAVARSEPAVSDVAAASHGAQLAR